MSDYNIRDVNEIYKSGNLAQAIFKYLARAERNKPVTDIDRLKVALREEGHAYSLEEIFRVFAAFEALGMGRLAPRPRGSTGVNNKFKWKVDWRDMAQKVLSVNNHASKKEPVAKETLFKNALARLNPPTKEMKEEATISTAGNTYIVPIRPGHNIRLTLPNNMTNKELDYLAEAIRGFKS